MRIAALPDPEQPHDRQRQRQAQYALLAVLRERWPQIFPVDFRQVKPFALGLHREIIKALPEVKPSLIRYTIHFYQCGGKGAYWRAILRGGPRYTLDGTPTGAVRMEDQEHAKQALARVMARWKARRAGPPRVTAPHDEQGENH